MFLIAIMAIASLLAFPSCQVVCFFFLSFKRIPGFYLLLSLPKKSGSLLVSFLRWLLFGVSLPVSFYSYPAVISFQNSF